MSKVFCVLMFLASFLLRSSGNCFANECIKANGNLSCTILPLEIRYTYNLSCTVPPEYHRLDTDKIDDDKYCSMILYLSGINPFQFQFISRSQKFTYPNDTCERVIDTRPMTKYHPLYPDCLDLHYTTTSFQQMSFNVETGIVCYCYKDDCQKTITVTLNVTNDPMYWDIITNLTSTTSPTTSKTTNNDSVHTPLHIVIGLLAFLFFVTLVAMIIILACYCHKNSTKGHRHSHQMNLHVQAQPSMVLNQYSEELPLSLIQTIGNGKFGSVWKAVYDGETVAVKIFNLHHKCSWQNEEYINTLGSTPHKNILPFIASISRGTGYGLQFFIITQYYPLGSLNQYLRHNILSWEQSWNMMHSVSRGLSHLHSTSYTNSDGVVLEKYAIAHRDVKSSNILVKDESGKCVLGDLGLALILDPTSDDKQLANSGQVGTYRYMAPEALDARVNLHDIESFKQIDAYALAFVLWEICTRCKFDEGGHVRPYQPPLYDVVGERPTVEQMREAVVVAKHRPTLSSYWYSNKSMQILIDVMIESWDEDPEARLTTANITDRLENMNTTNNAKLCTDQLLSVRQNEQNCLSPVSETSHSSFCKKVHVSASFSGSSGLQPFAVPSRFSMDNVGIANVHIQDLLNSDEGHHSSNDIQADSIISESDVQINIDKTTGQPKSVNETSDNN